MDVALIREDTLATLVLEGCTRVTVTVEGQVTSHPVPDRSTVSDGVLHRPTLVSLAVTVPVHRLLATRGFLQAAKAGGITLALQRPGEPQLPLLVVERYTSDEAETTSTEFQIRLKQVRIASSQSVETTLTDGPPRPDMQDSQADITETGTGTTTDVPTSLLRQGLDSAVETLVGLGAL